VVTRDTRWPAGTPCWVDVSVDDVPKAIAFYQALFGWDIQAGGPDAGGYAVCHRSGRIVAGIGPKFGLPDAPSAWTTYLAADDADAVADKIKAAGGQVAQGPMDVMEEGRMAVAFDSTGAAVAAAVTHGGSIVEPIRDSPYGRIGVVTDNQGAVFSVITTPQPQPGAPS
jgi:predicted enzyme related to lactoylglutathione lyase